MVVVCPACRLRMCRPIAEFVGVIGVPSLCVKSKNNTALRSSVDGHGRPPQLQKGLVDVAHRHANPAGRNARGIAIRRSDSHGGVVVKRKTGVVIHGVPYLLPPWTMTRYTHA